MNISLPLQLPFHGSSPANAPLPPRSGRPERGFSLIEALVAVALTGVLASLTVPASKALIGASRLTTTANDLLFSIHLARSEAIKRSSRVALCKTANGVACAAGGGWEQGWIVFHDANQNGERDPGEVVIQRIQPVGGGLRLTGNSPVARYVSYVATGSTKTTGGGFQAGTLTVCSIGASEARQIVLSAVGRPRIQKASLSACA
jgi:type IV fimbrial biogenesis protein FimT